MSDRGRSPEEIEDAIEHRQDELAEDLEQLEYRLSRRGMKDQAKERAARTRHELTERASELQGQAAERVRTVSSEARQRVNSWRREASQTADRNPWGVALVGSVLAVGIGALIAQMTKTRRSRPDRHTKRGAMIAWLNDAHANERAVLPIIRNHIRDARAEPAIRQRLEQHLADTERHAQLMKGCIERLGGKVSSAKGAAGGILGAVQAVSTEGARDELVKNALADYTMEEFEIASYRALIAGAEELGDAQTARVCREILDDEEYMAKWWESQIPLLTRRQLAALRDEQTAEAQHRVTFAS